MDTLKKILYVEDQQDIQVIARVALEQISQYELLICDEGEEALSQMPSFNPDLVLLDVMMPGMDGPETFQGIRQLEGFADTPVIFMTAKVLPSEIDQLMSMGALGVISKPFDPVKLGSQIEKLWEQQ